jgi:hypothetical protein
VLVSYMVRRSKPTRFRISATLARWFSISIEVDSQDRPDELPPRPGALAFLGYVADRSLNWLTHPAMVGWCFGATFA